ncbi:hypothetical protein [[Haemophilus] ducreyi]|uniref:hypothetical protein n=1 Tax=Haemophilus ducreyi TaxID=730 RepID=UPI00065502D3|nr:hypothetical protein [[Haemophilus] ducreyi]AKO46054.1 hypothetical protein RZ66_07655 [[Haemophilus] ducreyi]AKO47410.1 hypothetical protein RZ67_07420 [[Haemophilus] ducreyi]AKO48777.1 hypothetical protein RZ68_07500 [[Haemophilus] ducreyi]AKO49169.1 hypothetical protein RZ69_01780 [[Haemophilus] ducreyi]ANF61639.1 hypothetical protein A6037_02205 [[Haemophilus] ducreyi]
MSEQITKEECKNQLTELGVMYEKLPIAISKHICNATTELHGRTFKVEVCERIGIGVQIKVKGKDKSCLVTYEAMLNMAEAMGLFDNE